MPWASTCSGDGAAGTSSLRRDEPRQGPRPPGPADATGNADRAAGGRGSVQSGDRAAPLPLTPHGRLSPLSHVPEARHHLSGAGRRGARNDRRELRAEFSHLTNGTPGPHLRSASPHAIERTHEPTHDTSSCFTVMGDGREAGRRTSHYEAQGIASRPRDRGRVEVDAPTRPIRRGGNGAEIVEHSVRRRRLELARYHGTLAGGRLSRSARPRVSDRPGSRSLAPTRACPCAAVHPGDAPVLGTRATG